MAGYPRPPPGHGHHGHPYRGPHPPYGAPPPPPPHVMRPPPPGAAGHGGGGSPFASLVPSPAAGFPPGTDPNVVACFKAADRDGSGVIDDRELQAALSTGHGHAGSQSFSIRTVHLLMYVFTNSNVRKIGECT